MFECEKRNSFGERVRIINGIHIILTVFFFVIIAAFCHPTEASDIEGDDDPGRNGRSVLSRIERSAVVEISDHHGNQLYDNGTIVFAARVESDVDQGRERYELGEEDYEWENSLGSQAAVWVREGVVRSVPPKQVIDLLKAQLVSDDFDIVSTIKQVLMVELPVIITSFILILMAVIMPLVGLVFCCCRCAGKCGGRRNEDDLATLSKAHGVVDGLVLLIVFAFIVTASYLTNPSMIRMVDTVNQTNTMATSVLQDVETFKDDFIQDLRRVGIDDLGFVLDAVESKLDDVGVIVASPLLSDATPLLEDLSESVENLAQGLTSLTADGSTLDIVLNTTADLVSAGQSLESVLSTAKGTLTTIRDDCLADGHRNAAGACDAIPDPSILDTSFDLSTLETDQLDLDTVRSEMQSALTTIRDLVRTGNGSLQDVPEMIVNTSRLSISGIHNVTGELQQMIQELVNSTSASLDDIFESLNLDSVKETVSDTIQVPLQQSYIDIITSCLPVVFAFMVIITVLGLLFSLCGLRSCDGPGEQRGCCCDCGGRMLMGSVCWSFSVSFFLCLLAAIALIVGSTFTIVCDSLLDMSIIREVVDDPATWGGVSLTEQVSFGNATFNVTMHQILEDCKEDETLFNVLDLESSGFLDIVLSLDLREMLPSFDSLFDTVNDTVSSMEILPSSEADDLLGQVTNQLSPQNISSAVSQVQSGLDQILLTNLSQGLNDIADAVDGSFPAMATDLRNLADELIAIDEQELEVTVNLTVSLSEEVSRLNVSIQGIEIISAQVSDSVSTLGDFITNNAGSLLVQSLDAYIESILSLADQFIDEVVRRIREDIGRCGIVRNVYDAVTGSLCLYFLPGLNVFWFALAVISFALIPSIILNVFLAKYLRSPTHRSSSPARQALQLQGVAVFPPGAPPTLTSLKRRLSESLVNNVHLPSGLAARLHLGGKPAYAEH